MEHCHERCSFFGVTHDVLNIHTNWQFCTFQADRQNLVLINKYHQSYAKECPLDTSIVLWNNLLNLLNIYLYAWNMGRNWKFTFLWRLTSNLHRMISKSTSFILDLYTLPLYKESSMCCRGCENVDNYGLSHSLYLFVIITNSNILKIAIILALIHSFLRFLPVAERTRSVN